MRLTPTRPASFKTLRRRSVRQLLERLILGESGPEAPRRGRLLLERLEQRQLLAGDMDLMFTDGEVETQSAAETSGLQVAGQAEGELAPDLQQFAKDLADAGVQFFGAHWCPACTQQKELFADGKDNLPFIEVTNSDRSLNSIGVAENISVFPTWDFPSGTRLTGVLSLETLSTESGVAIPQSEQPTFEPIDNLTVQIGSPLHVPIDAYDPDGGPLTVTVSIQDPSLLEATVLSGNRSIRIDMATYGDMVFELFEQRAPVASGRVADLAEDGFYDGIIFHRVLDDFVIQGGDPNGTGTSGSTLGTFSDDFHPDLQHNREGVLSFAKSSDDTNNSQFFVTEVPTRFLDFNHSIFGQLVEGFDARDAISETSTPKSRGAGSSETPDNTVAIETIEVFNDTENSVVMLKAIGGTGATSVTFTVTDQDGNSHSETVLVTVAADNQNSQPFLNGITTPGATQRNTATQLQLSSADVEGDAVTYFAQSLSNDATVSVDSTTGLVTVTPAANFVGTVDVEVGVRPGSGVTGNGANDRDTERVSFLFEGEAVLAPSSVDLLSGSDSGLSDSDNITNDGSLSFLVEGVADGSTVELINTGDGAVIGSGLATGTSITIATNNIAALGDGTYQVAARQRSGNDTSTLSPSLTIVYDTDAPDSVIASAPTQGNVDRPFQADLISSEEGSGLIYALSSAPTGATIEAATGVVNWTPTDSQLGENTLSVLLTDVAGNTLNESFTVNVAAPPLAEIKLEVTDLQNNPITEIGIGDEFILHFIGVDARSSFTRDGVFAAFADILFDSSLVQPVAGQSIDFTDRFPISQKGALSDGLIDEIGAATDRLTASDLRESLIATVRMEALASGTVNIRSEPADDSDSEVLLYGNDNQIPAETVAYGNVTLTIGQNFTVGDDNFAVDEDSGATQLDVLANDVVISGSDTLTVVSVTQPSSGGTVSLSGGVLSFTPDANFEGPVEFAYRVSDSGGVQEDGSVTVTVLAVNDSPLGVGDVFNVDLDSVDNSLDVLGNDSFAPDTNESLVVSAVGTPNNGGSVTIGADGLSINYTPATGFNGTESFTYTVSDGELTDQVVVNVTVAPADNPPTAVDDSFGITEDDVETAYNVQANDQQDVDNQTFVIASVGTPNNGGSARVSSNGSQFLYAPAADFTGTEEVTYTIRDTGGGLSLATVTFTVAAVNDAPPILNPTIDLNRDPGETAVFELSDLPDNVDSGETLTISSVATTTTEGGTVRIDAATQTILYTPPSTDFTGTDTFAYSIGDGELSTSGTITVTVADFTVRSLELTLPESAGRNRISGIRLTGTDLLGHSVDMPLTYGAGKASFADLFPGSYVIEIPAIPFLQNAGQPRQISVESLEDDGDATVDSGIGQLRPEFISIRDWLGSAPVMSILVAVAPGETSVLAIESPATDTIDDAVVELDASGTNLTIRGTTTNTGTSAVDDIEATIPVQNNSRVQLRGEVNGLRLLRISVEQGDVTFTESTTSGAEGEFISVNTLSVGDVQAEGESVAAGGVTQADLFVPVASDVVTRTDATVLALEDGDLWVGESLQAEPEQQTGNAADAVDSAMQDVAEELTVSSTAADSIADLDAADEGIDKQAIDAVLATNL
jgi:cyclophilin family peptidyl-prolyl cis-trans isomerase